MSALNTAISLTTVADVKSWLSASGEDLYKSALWVYYDGANSTATVQVTDDNIILTDSSAHTFSLTGASYDTITELVSEINDLTGWNAGALCNGSAESKYLRTTGALDCKGSSAEQTLDIEDILLIEELINRASDFINKYCGYVLKSTSYTREVYYGSGGMGLVLDNFPVTQVSRVSSGRQNALKITNTSTDMNYATVEITTSAMNLIVDGGANEDSSELTLADYNSIDDLITAIEALDKGWSVSAMVDDSDSLDSSELLPRPALSIKEGEYAYFEVADEEIADFKVKNFGRTENPGIITKPSGWSPGFEYFVDYTAGYATIPADLEEICIELVCFKYGKSKKAGSEDLKSESFGKGADYKYERFSLADLKAGLTPELFARLEYYRDLRL